MQATLSRDAGVRMVLKASLSTSATWPGRSPADVPVSSLFMLLGMSHTCMLSGRDAIIGVTDMHLDARVAAAQD